MWRSKSRILNSISKTHQTDDWTWDWPLLAQPLVPNEALLDMDPKRGIHYLAVVNHELIRYDIHHLTMCLLCDWTHLHPPPESSCTYHCAEDRSTECEINHSWKYGLKQALCLTVLKTLRERKWDIQAEVMFKGISLWSRLNLICNTVRLLVFVLVFLYYSPVNRLL